MKINFDALINIFIEWKNKNDKKNSGNDFVFVFYSQVVIFKWQTNSLIYIKISVYFFV